MDEVGKLVGGLAILSAGATLLIAAWLIGVQGWLWLITNYRAHPERYPDGEGLGRRVGWTLAAGGLSLAACGVALLAGALTETGVLIWSLATAVALVGALLRIEHHGKSKPASQSSRGR